jgi:predicted DNA-binding protein
LVDGKEQTIMSAERKLSASVVKLPATTHAKLQELSKAQHRPMGEIVTELVERYERERFWDEVEASVARLKADPVAWQDYQDEIALLEGGSMDGLEQEPPYFTAEELEEIRAHNPRPAIG